MQYEIREVDELSHYGITGQRWGIRRFQNKDGSLTDEGRKRYGSLSENLSKWSNKIKAKVVTANETAKEKREKKREQQEEASEEKRKKIVATGRPKEIAKHISEFSESELSEIKKRFDTELAVKDQIDKLTKIDTKVDKRSDKISKAIDFLATNTSQLERSVSSAKNFYNTVATINNSLRENPSGARGLTAGQSGYMTPIS